MYRYKFFIFILFFSLLQLLHSQNLKCYSCGKNISGQYVRVGEKVFHTNHFKCAKCGNLIAGPYSEKDGKFYHQNCFYQQQGLKCSVCGKIIKGKYYSQNGKYIHPKCYRETHAKCSVCGKIIEGKYIEKNSLKYHPECYSNNVLEKCDVCGKPLEGKYYIDSHGNKYHSYHNNSSPKCDNCSRIISPKTTGGGKQYSDGRNICNICFSKSLSGSESIVSLYNKVLSSLNKLGIKIDAANITVKGVNRNELRFAAKENYTKALKGYCQSTIKSVSIDGAVHKKYYHTIYVLDGIPKEYLEATIAHEIMHAWFIQHTKNGHTAMLLEGSCNYASYLYLSNNISALSSEVIKVLDNDPNHIYGDGFRRVKMRFINSTVQQFLNFLRANISI